MVIYFADRRMNTLGLATTELQGGFTASDDLKIEDTDTGVASFECIIHWTDETRELAEACTAAGNYLLRSNNNENEFYTIVEVEKDTKDQMIYIYAEDAGMDLLNETVGAFAADTDHPIAWYVNKYAADTGFEIGINEISDLSRKLEWTGEATAAERIASVATQFDNAEISYSFDIKGLEITHKYINIHKKRGKDAGVQLRLNREIDRIITTTSIADLATALYVTGGTPEGEEDPITLEGYKEEDSGGDIYTDGDGLVKSRSALATWSRYVWSGEPNQVAGETGQIVKQWSYDTTSQSELFHRAVTQLSRICEPAVNYEIDIQQLPENVAIGDYVDIVDEQGELYLQSRILQLETSICNQKQTATLGEFLIKDSGISQTVRELAEQFEQLAKSRTYYTWVAYADDEYGNGISLDPTGKEYMGIATNRTTPTVDISDPSVFTWSRTTGVGIEEINVYYGTSMSPTEVPTEWSLEPPTDTVRNEYVWSYTEYIYTSGLVETTKPTIIAYYDYISVDELEAKVANIEYLLAGEESVGELEAIHLTAKNVVIDNEVVNDLIAARIDAGKIVSGTIYTDYVKIANNEGQALWIDGATIQMKDGNGTVRIQMGMDAQGDYDYYLMDENENIIWDARGLTEEGLIGNGAIIRDEAVSDDAAIQGHKLDIVSVANAINENGNAVINASNVHIGDDSLDVWYTTIEQEIEGISKDGLMKITPMYLVCDSAESPVGETTTRQFSETFNGRVETTETCYIDVTVEGWIPTSIESWQVSNGADEVGPPVLNGNMVEITLEFYGRVDVVEVVVVVVGYSDAVWSETQPSDIGEDEYVWMCYKCDYADGHTEYTSPTLFMDAKTVSTMQTQLSMVQGEISAGIWKTDIKEAVADIWSQFDMKVGEVSISVGGMETTIDDLGNLIDSTYAAKASLVLEYDSDNKTARMTATAGEIYITAQQRLIIDSTGFSLTKDGYIIIDQKNFSLDESGNLNASNVTISGEVHANSGTIGDFTINSALYTSSKSSFTSTANGVFLGTAGISLGSTFSVDNAGALTSTSGTIGGWAISASELSNSDSGGNGIVLGLGSITSTSRSGLTSVLTGSNIRYSYNGTEYGGVGLLAANLGSSGTITTYENISIYPASSGNGVEIGYYGTKNDVTTTWPAIGVYQGNEMSYWGGYRIVLHEDVGAKGSLTFESYESGGSGYYKIANTVMRCLTGVTPSSFSGPPSGYRPLSETWLTIIVANSAGTICVLGGIHLYPDSSTARIYYYSSSGAITEITSSSSYRIFGTLTYLTC